MASAGCYDSAHSPAVGVGERGTNCQVREPPKREEHKHRVVKEGLAVFQLHEQMGKIKFILEAGLQT